LLPGGSGGYRRPAGKAMNPAGKARDIPCPTGAKPLHSRPALAIAAIACALALPASAAVKKVPYPEVKVDLAEAFKPDAAFEAMHKKFRDAVAKKDGQALFPLVGPTFLWTYQGGPTDEFDMGRDALHNFKVLFGFRPAGANADGPVENGPFWDLLGQLSDEDTYYQDTQSGNLVCSPTTANAQDDNVFEQARNKIETGDDGVDWYFTLAPTSVAKAPNDTGPPVAKVGTVALPALSLYPVPQDDKPAVPATHIEVLLPSGKSGFVPVTAVRLFDAERLCYAKTANGDWKIASFDQQVE
jgi:hypothetical protein